MKELNRNFLIELLKYSLTSVENFDSIFPNLKEDYIPDREIFEIFKAVANYRHIKNKMPTMSFLQVKYQNDDECSSVLADISKVGEIDEESILSAFEDFIRRVLFMLDYNSIGELFNKGKREAAYQKFQEASEKIYGFTLKRNRIDKVFGDYEKRVVKRYLENNITHANRIPFGIDELDRYTQGIEFGEYYLALGDTGTGKSFFLVHHGVTAARMGFNVLHFQCEGTKKQIQDRYDSCWTGLAYYQTKYNNFSDEEYKQYLKILKSMSGEIYVEAIQKFSERPSVRDIRKLLVDFNKRNIKIHLVLIDYLELLNPVETRWEDEVQRQGLISRNFKDIAVEFDCAVGSVTQANRVSKELLNDPNFVLARDNLAESYPKLRPVDLFFTFNQTIEEKKKKILRIFIDKAREHDSKLRFSIFQNLAHSRFYSKKKTIEKLMKSEDD